MQQGIPPIGTTMASFANAPAAASTTSLLARRFFDDAHAVPLTWNTMVEDVVDTAPDKGKGAKAAPLVGQRKTSLTPSRLSEISTDEERSRIVTGIGELDRVLGGGIVLGSVVLLGGEPGTGKSTVLLQLCGAISRDRNMLYVTGEESVRQIKLRADRLKMSRSTVL